eukprot:scaffold25766_cov58-Phaeocystis_antarctica.AAC.2
MPHLPKVRAMPAEHISAHAVCSRLVWSRPNNPRRQRLEPLVVPPLWLGRLVALLQLQHVEGLCRGPCPFLRAHWKAVFGLKVPLRGLHVVTRVRERVTEVVVRHGLVGPQGDGLAVGLGCFAPVLLRGVPNALSYQLRVRIARLRGLPGLPLRGLAILLLRRPTILPTLPLLPQLLVNSCQAPGFPGHSTPQRYVVGTGSSRCKRGSSGRRGRGAKFRDEGKRPRNSLRNSRLNGSSTSRY